MNNPLLHMEGLPPFSRIKPEHIEPAIDHILQQNKATLAQLTSQEQPSWDSLIAPLEAMEDYLSRVWSPVRHMNSVLNSDELRAAYNACLPKLSDYSTELSHNEELYRAYQQIADQESFTQLSQAQQKIIRNALRDFHLAGVDLPAPQKKRYKEIQLELSSLKSTFEENILDATNAWSINFPNQDRLNGLPDSALSMARQTATERNESGWTFTLDFPSYYAIINYADDRALRREIYEAYSTRASEQGPNAGKWDNSPIMEQILALRHEMARLLGFDSYAHYSLATKMAESPQQVLDFLQDLARRCKPIAEQDIEQLRAFARSHGLEDELQPWDTAYYSEKQRQHLFDFTEEQLKPYFSEQQVLYGLFEVVSRLYGIAITEHHGVDTWHKDVRFFDIHDQQGHLRGHFYLDLYARPKKRGGAWMDECATRRRTESGLQIPVAYLVCNLTPPIGDEPAQFTHSEVVTLFHEFGHGLHHMLTQVDYAGVSGINGVAWDAVELPSQFMENWCWEREALDIMARHFRTDEVLPAELYEKMKAARNYQSSMKIVRQLEFALFDFRLHLEYEPEQGPRIQQLLDEVRRQVAVLIPPRFNRFQHSFSHIFAGGYGAGYYSYLWAEVLSADAFSMFEESGIFSRQAGEKFLHNVLEQGGTRDAMDLFVDFRGREPRIEPLLRHNGITT